MSKRSADATPDVPRETNGVRKLGSDTPKNRGNAGKGRPKGSTNKITRTVREAFVEAFEKVNQGPTALAEWGKDNPDKFYLLASKLIPTDITSGDKAISGVVVLPASSE